MNLESVVWEDDPGEVASYIIRTLDPSVRRICRIRPIARRILEHKSIFVVELDTEMILTDPRGYAFVEQDVAGLWVSTEYPSLQEGLGRFIES